MKNLVFAVLVTGIFNVHAKPIPPNDVVYNQDDRIPAKDVNINIEQIQSLSSGIAALVLTDEVTFHGDKASIYTLDEKETNDICTEEKYSSFPAMSMCTAFLISDKLLVTAGHCITNDNCIDKDFSFVFNYNHQSVQNEALEFNSSDIYTCKKVVARKKDDKNHLDYAIVELDKKVKNRTILKFAKTNPKLDDSIFMLGHPYGLPLIYTDNAQIHRTEENRFITNLDAFGGNSGSPVLNQNGNVIGVLIEGSQDFIWDKQNRCNHVHYCNGIDPNNKCEGEGVLKKDIIIKALKEANKTI